MLRRALTAARPEVLAIFRAVLRDLPPVLPLIVLLTRWLRSALSLALHGLCRLLAPAFSANASHPRAPLLPLPGTMSTKTPFPKRNYVLASLYLL